MRNTTILIVAAAVVALSACNSHPPEAVAPTYWELDNSSLEWGAAGNISTDETSWDLTVAESAESGVLSFIDRQSIQGGYPDITNCTALLDDSGDEPYELTVSCEGNPDFNVQIDGDTLTYEREAAVGTIRATFSQTSLE